MQEDLGPVGFYRCDFAYYDVPGLIRPHRDLPGEQALGDVEPVGVDIEVTRHQDPLGKDTFQRH